VKNEKWFKDILSSVKFGEGFPIAKFYYHPLYRVGVGKNSDLDYIFGRNRKLPLKNLRKFKFFRFEAPFPTDSVIFFQSGRKRLIIASQKEGKVLKVSVSPEQLSLLEGEIKELKHQNQSEFASHSVKLLDHGTNWIMTSFCSNRDSVVGMPILELHELVMGPMTKFYSSHDWKKVSLKEWLIEAKKRAKGHPSILLIQKVISQLEQGPDFELINGQLHFDLHQGNVLRDKDHLVIIDWEVSHSGLLIVDYFDFYRRLVKEERISTKDLSHGHVLQDFYSGFQDWLKLFGINLPAGHEKAILRLYSLERTLIYFEKWNENRLDDKAGFEFKVTLLD